jgi:hypothetical protein
VAPYPHDSGASNRHAHRPWVRHALRTEPVRLHRELSQISLVVRLVVVLMMLLRMLVLLLLLLGRHLSERLNKRLRRRGTHLVVQGPTTVRDISRRYGRPDILPTFSHRQWFLTYLAI